MGSEAGGLSAGFWGSCVRAMGGCGAETEVRQ